MEKILELSRLVSYAETALLDGLDYIANNRIYSTWTKRDAGWQEQWLQSKFTGLFATCNAVMLLSQYPDRYAAVTTDAVEEMRYMFDSREDYVDASSDSDEERKRKGRCRLLLEQNLHTTLKAVYFLKAYEALRARGIHISEDPAFVEIVEAVYAQVDSVFQIESGRFAPALDNWEDVSILSTMQAFIVMKDYWGADSENTKSTKRMLMNCVRDYIAYRGKRKHRTSNKFDAYQIKSGFVAALYSLSNTSEILDEAEREVLAEAFFLSMSDADIRCGYTIKDSYSVPNTILARDAYAADSKVLYLYAAIRLMRSGILPFHVVEYLLDDIEEIIDTTRERKQYLSWDSSPSFSHNIRGLMVLKELVDWLKDAKDRYVVCKIMPHMQGADQRAVTPTGVVLFMSFSKDYSESIQESVREVLDYIGFQIWWATNDPYDAFVVDNILDKLSKAQFAIIDCSERSANVMYEAGWAHGLGKPTLLCGSCDEVFPYEQAEPFDTCIFESDGEKNPPPYRDLQKGIACYIIDHIEEFCLTGPQKRQMLENARIFIEDYCD